MKHFERCHPLCVDEYLVVKLANSQVLTMENVVLLNKSRIPVESKTYPDLKILHSCFDALADSIICTLGSNEEDTIEIQLLSKRSDNSVLASFRKPQINSRPVSIKQFIDERSFVIVFDTGDIVQGIYDDGTAEYEEGQVQIIGLIDTGIEAARWSPDDDRLVIYTGDKNLLLLSKTFEPIIERKCGPNDVLLADDKNVSVGWGKEETQFKGKGFKALEREKEALKYAGLDLKEDTDIRDPTVALAQTGVISPNDNGATIIDWRDDCHYFVLSTVEKVNSPGSDNQTRRRVLRILDRDGNLKAVSEALDGLEGCVSWRTLGFHIACPQRIVDTEGNVQRNVIFIEKNGLSHGGFELKDLREDEVIEELSWSCDGKVLFVRLSNRIQMWTTKNYHWYLKTVMFADAARIVEISGHPEKPLQFLYASTSFLYVVAFNFVVSSGPALPPHDNGLIVVTDGKKVMLTPLGQANIPPPMSLHDIIFSAPINTACVDAQNSMVAGLTCNDRVCVSKLDVPESDNESKRWHFEQTFDGAKQLCFVKNRWIFVLADLHVGSMIYVLDVNSRQVSASIPSTSKLVYLTTRTDFSCAIVESVEGSVFQIDESGSMNLIGSLPQMCLQVNVGLVHQSAGLVPVIVGLSTTGKAFAGSKTIATSVTSLHLSESHICLTTAQARLHFIRLENLDETVSPSADSAHDERSRMIEKGSTIVTSIPSKYSLVLQAHRGNLETIYPRIMVLQAIRSFIRQREYLNAFLACRAHRIDLDLLHDYDPAGFDTNIERFVKQIGRADHLDLFISCLHDEDVAFSKYKETFGQNDSAVNESTKKSLGSTKVNDICNKLITFLTKLDFQESLFQVHLTALACQRPPKESEALMLISQMKNIDHKEDAISHLCFLLDTNKLYISALKIYDIHMALEIAQKTQMDPKEYLPFLQKLNVVSEMRKRFLIDDYLENYGHALLWLYKMENPVPEEFDEYVETHSLYKDALRILKYDEKWTNNILIMFANHLFNTQSFTEAGHVFEGLGDDSRAFESFVCASKWREAMSLHYKGLGQKEIAFELVGKLEDDKKYNDCAMMYHYIIKDTQKAVELYCAAHKFSDAILLATQEMKLELIDEVVDPRLKEEYGVIAELLADCQGQITLQLSRLRDLRQKKREDPLGFYGSESFENDAPDDVSIAPSEASTTPSFFTRYTGKTAGTAKTGASRRTSKNRKREERKKAKGRKGTIYEEEYLINSVGRLVERINQTLEDAIIVVETLIRRKMRHQAHQIQSSWVELTDFLSEHIVEVYSISEKDRERFDEDGNLYIIPPFQVPKIEKFPVKVTLDY